MKNKDLFTKKFLKAMKSKELSSEENNILKSLKTREKK